MEDVYEMLLLQVASEMGLMTLAWLVGKTFFLPELINQLVAIKLIIPSRVLRGHDLGLVPFRISPFRQRVRGLLRLQLSSRPQLGCAGTVPPSALTGEER